MRRVAYFPHDRPGDALVDAGQLPALRRIYGPCGIVAFCTEANRELFGCLAWCDAVEAYEAGEVPAAAAGFATGDTPSWGRMAGQRPPGKTAMEGDGDDRNDRDDGMTKRGGNGGWFCGGGAWEAAGGKETFETERLLRQTQKQTQQRRKHHADKLRKRQPGMQNNGWNVRFE